MFFLAGGLCYIYRDVLARVANNHTVFVMLGIFGTAVLYYLAAQKNLAILLWCAMVLIYAMRTTKQITLLSNPVVKWLSGISMEVYLSHMVAFRFLEKLRLTHLSQSDIFSYAITVCGTAAGTILLSVIFQKVFESLRQVRSDKKCPKN